MKKELFSTHPHTLEEIIFPLQDSNIPYKCESLKRDFLIHATTDNLTASFEPKRSVFDYKNGIMLPEEEFTKNDIHLLSLLEEKYSPLQYLDDTRGDNAITAIIAGGAVLAFLYFALIYISHPGMNMMGM